MLTRVRSGLMNLKVRWVTSKYSIAGQYARLYHYHLRKTAGTSLNAAFWQLAGLTLREVGTRQRVCRNGFVFVRQNREWIEQGNYFLASSHAPAHMLTLPEDTFTLTVLRDPLKRVLSHYRYLLWARENPHAYDEEPFLDDLHREFDWLGESFGDFLQRIPRNHLQRQLYFFSADYDVNEARQRILSCSAVCFTETFGDDLRQLAEHLQLPLQESRERRFVREISITPEEMEFGREMLKDEFTLYEQVWQARTRAKDRVAGNGR